MARYKPRPIDPVAVQKVAEVAGIDEGRARAAVEAYEAHRRAAASAREIERRRQAMAS